MRMSKFNIASINCCTESEGPYKRLCIWFQGCNIRCKGCCNPEYQQIVPKHIMSSEELVALIKNARNQFGIEGVTYSGGEPTLQQNLPFLTAEIQKTGLGVICFTGRRYEDVKDLLTGCDVVLDGPFLQEYKEEQRRILGSKNQRILCLTDRYKDCIEQWFSLRNGRTIEANFGEKIIINGDRF